MQPQPLKTTLLMSTIFTVLVLLFVTLTDEPSVQVIAVNGVLVFAIIFFTMRLTNRITVVVVNRFGRKADAAPPDEESAPPPEPTSARPEHAQRRRQRRRSRRRHRE